MKNSQEIGRRLVYLCEEQSRWSQETFGHDTIRGSIGPLKHLEKEAKEAQEKQDDIMEYADCLLLVIDASRRAGFDITALIIAAEQKLIINRNRQWPKMGVNDAVEHIK